MVIREGIALGPLDAGVQVVEEFETFEAQGEQVVVVRLRGGAEGEECGVLLKLVERGGQSGGRGRHLHDAVQVGNANDGRRRGECAETVGQQLAANGHALQALGGGSHGAGVHALDAERRGPLNELRGGVRGPVFADPGRGGDSLSAQVCEKGKKPGSVCAQLRARQRKSSEASTRSRPLVERANGRGPGVRAGQTG